MNLEACFRHLAGRWEDELVVTSAGTASSVWWEVTGAVERVFYLEASMGLASMLAAGVALGLPEAHLWAFSGDGAFVMNPGMLMIENDLRLPNLVHFLVSNRCYGATGELPLPGARGNDYAAMARAMGIQRVFAFDSIEALDRGLDEVLSVREYAFVVLEVERLGRPVRTVPLEGPEMKYRFGRHIERTYGRQVFLA